MNNVKLISSSNTVSPVTLAAFKQHIGFNATDLTRDDSFTLLLEAATDDAQKYTGLQLMPVDYELYLTGFSSLVEIEISPVVEITSIKYYDAANTEQRIDDDQYEINLYANPVEITFLQLPTVYDRFDAVKIAFTSGFADAASVPPSIKAAILLIAADLYVNPSDAVRSMPTASRNLLRNYRLFNLENSQK